MLSIEAAIKHPLRKIRKIDFPQLVRIVVHARARFHADKLANGSISLLVRPPKGIKEGFHRG